MNYNFSMNLHEEQCYKILLCKLAKCLGFDYAYLDVGTELWFINYQKSISSWSKVYSSKAPLHVFGYREAAEKIASALKSGEQMTVGKDITIDISIAAEFLVEMELLDG